MPYEREFFDCPYCGAHLTADSESGWPRCRCGFDTEQMTDEEFSPDMQPDQEP